VLDVACGTGVVARHAARRVGECGRVVGVDVNDGMLAVTAGIAPGMEPYMSSKTASVHVSRILRKLGVHGRVEAAAVARRVALE
jgi:SAM-dependent methyltransferase